MIKSIVVAISGASGVRLGKRFVKFLPKDIKKYVILTESAKIVFDKEDDVDMLQDDDLSQISSSGSSNIDAMAIIPTSMNTLAKIACGISDNLTTRSAAVMIKERKTLLLAPREMPFSSIALENMLKLSKLGVIISPPVAGYYHKPKNLEQMEEFWIGKWFDILKIENTLYKRWKVED